MFFFKKIVSRLFFPFPLSLEFLLLGLLLLWFTRRQRLGKALVTCGTLLLVAVSNSFTSNAFLRPLEHRYPAFTVLQSGVGPNEVGYIAVLGGWADHDPEVPVSSRLSPDLMVRLVEGVRLHRQFPASKLIVSGGNDSARGMMMMAEALGVNPADILPLDRPRDTEEESQQIQPIVGGNSFILVTSAAHMPRAISLFRKRGMQPVPAPTNYLAARHGFEFDDVMPDGYNLFKTQVAWYEYLGRAWARLRGKT
jgi:uncharacterized SAM-binding protein YcdF (DUF218 family)